MARIDPEASLARQAAAAQYADLPTWCRPGRRVALFGWTGGQRRDSVSTATVTRATKTRVMFTYVARGATVENWVHRDQLAYRDGHGSGRRLANPASDEVRDAVAVRDARDLEARIVKAFAQRTGSTGLYADQTKSLQTRSDVVDLLDEVLDIVTAVRHKYFDQLEQEGS